MSGASPDHLGPIPDDLHGHVAGPASVRHHTDVMKLSLQYRNEFIQDINHQHKVIKDKPHIIPDSPVPPGSHNPPAASSLGTLWPCGEQQHHHHHGGGIK